MDVVRESDGVHRKDALGQQLVFLGAAHRNVQHADGTAAADDPAFGFEMPLCNVGQVVQTAVLGHVFAAIGARGQAAAAIGHTE